MVDRLSGVPMYRQVADDLASAIQAGRYQPGMPIPSLNEIAEIYGVSRPTAKSAIRRLAQMGVVTIKGGDYTRVRRRREVEVVRVPRGLRVGSRMPTDEERERLGIEDGVPVLVILEPVARADGVDWVESADRDPLPADRHQVEYGDPDQSHG